MGPGDPSSEPQARMTFRPSERDHGACAAACSFERLESFEGRLTGAVVPDARKPAVLIEIIL